MLPIRASIFALLATGCASGPTPDAPRSNFLARAKIMAANERSISIEHSDWGRGTAFAWAAEHCVKGGLTAVHVSSSPGYGANTLSTWRCE